MELATSFSNYLKLPARQSITTDIHPTCTRHDRLARKVFIKARNDDHVHHGSGELVDKNMIVLRMRIKEMKMLESGHDQPPSNWMEWERNYFATHYNKDVLEAIGLLQSFLMNTRPSLALGMLAILALSLPISTSLLLLNFIEVVKGLYFSASGFHPS